MSKHKKGARVGVRHLVPCLKGYVLPSVLTPILIIGEVALEVVIPLLMAAIVDGGLYHRSDYQLQGIISKLPITNDLQFILWVGGAMALISLLSLLFGVLASRTSAVASMGFAKNLRRAIFRKIQSFSFKNTDRFQTSSLVMRTTTDVNNLQNTYQMLIRIFVRSPVMMVMAAIMAIRINWELSLIFLIALPIIFGAMMLLISIGRKRFSAMLKQYDSMNGAVQENLIAMRVVKSFVRQEHEKEKFRLSADDLQRAQIYAQKIFSISNPIQLGIMWGCTILLLALGGAQVVAPNATLNIGELTSLMSYSTQVISSLTMVSFLIIGLSMTKVSLDRVNEIFEEQPDITTVDPKVRRVEHGRIEFDHVSFSYSGNPERKNLQDITFTVEAGETVGILGGTGDGKSTLVQLIPRLYDVMEGAIRIDGYDVRDYDLVGLRDGVAMVLQKNMLFSGSIRDNMRWGNPEATDEQIREACRIACADEFVMARPDGYDSDLGQGGCNVSGGQKQRLCIARALLKEPKILILDDSTSAVDTATDEKIRHGLKNYLPGTTKIIIAQRIASVMDADKILIMGEGRIVDMGTHGELLKTSEVYRDIYESQVREVDA